MQRPGTAELEPQHHLGEGQDSLTAELSVESRLQGVRSRRSALLSTFRYRIERR